MRAYSTNIEHEAESSGAFRRVLFTGQKVQLVVMSLLPGEEIGAEVHSDTDQMFLVVEGTALVETGENIQHLEEDSVIVIPAGLRHNITNPSSYRDLKLCTIYAPPEHAPDTVHRTKADAESVRSVLV